MMVDERESRNGDGCDLNCSMGKTTEGTDNIEGGLLLDGSSGGFSAGEGTSAERLRVIYKRRKRRKTSCSDEKTMTEFSDKIKAGDGSASDHDDDAPRLIIDTSPNGLRHCRKVVLQQMHQSRNAVITYPESGCTPAVKESVDNVARSDNQICNAAKGLPVVTSSRLLNQSEGPTISKLCEHAFSDILISDKFSELCGLLLKSFGVVNVNQVLDLDAINTKIKSGAYETSPKLYHNDIRQVWTKLQQVGNEIVTLANSLSDNSQAHYEQQFVRKPKSTAGSKCHGCGGMARPENCLVCDSCEEVYHVSCTDLEMQTPPKIWYCVRCCIANGSGSPHENCIVCEKLKTSTATASAAAAARVPTNAAGEGEPDPDPERTGGTKACFICKTDVHPGDDFRTCGHSLCAHKFYHCKCLTSKQLGVCGPCWYCPSCLCRRCLIDKDDDQVVLCDGCDQAYHIYCTTPQLRSIPDGAWFCGKCDRELTRIRRMKMLYEKKVKEEEEEEEQVAAGGGLEMLVTAAKTLSHQETMTMDSSHKETTLFADT